MTGGNRRRPVLRPSFARLSLAVLAGLNACGKKKTSPGEAALASPPRVAAQPMAPAVSMHQGRYLGWLDPGAGAPKIGLVMHLFVVKPDDPEEFPVLKALLRESLGGLEATEYETETYDDIQFDFQDGTISMGGAANDLAVTAQVAQNATMQTVIDGQAFARSSAVAARVHMVELSGADGADPGTLPPDQYKPLLGGQYDGVCQNGPAVLQLETARGLGPVGPDRHGLASYLIHGRIGAATGLPSTQAFLVRSYASGTYDYFNSRLLLDGGDGTDDCQVAGDAITCSVHLPAGTSPCTFKREPSVVPPARFFPRAEHVQATPAQLAPLPPPNPPANADLIAALGGTFTGYLHHESSNRYQVMALNVMAYSSTNNPHNENLVYISGESVLSFGPTPSAETFVQPFDPRSFFLVPGFALASASADAVLTVDAWDMGFIRGTLYSTAFGRVGTFELIKGSSLPPIGAQAEFVPSVVGDFVGPRDKQTGGANLWGMSIIVPTQSLGAGQSTLQFLGQVRRADVAMPPVSISGGAYDFYSGGIGWCTTDQRMMSGVVADGPAMQLFWPAAPALNTLLDTDHGLYEYAH